jgi:aryl-alcohol dehydrogenase-like predicted oxidoreductase
LLTEWSLMTMPDYGSVLSKTYPLCLGGNVFGWTMNDEESYAVLDAYAAAGGNFVDTADVYSVWVDGHSGGESETIIGEWMRSRGNRDQMIVATKVGQLSGVGAADIRKGADDSLRRLQTDHIDLYYVHKDDEATPLEETLGALNELVQAGKVGDIGLCGYTPERLSAALAISDREGFARYRAIQPHYNLLERDAYEGPLQELSEREGLACVPFFSLARGFLTGKYRPGVTAETKRGGFGWTDEWDDRSKAVLAALDDVAERRNAPIAAVALAWLRAQPTVHSPIASARTVAQLEEILPMADLELSADEVAQLTDAGALSASA